MYGIKRGRAQELNEAQAKRAQASQGYELTSKELSVTKPLIASGAVSEVELLRLERDVGRFRGERGTRQIGNVVDWVAVDPKVFVGSAIADVSIAVARRSPANSAPRSHSR